MLTSQSQLTLLMLSLIILGFILVMALAEWVRARLLIRTGVAFDEALNGRIFRAGFRAELEKSGHNPTQALSDLTTIRQFLTGSGTIAFFDAHPRDDHGQAKLDLEVIATDGSEVDTLTLTRSR